MTGNTNKGKSQQQNRQFRGQNKSNTSSSPNTNNATTNSKTKEYTFYLHDSQSRKHAESFSKIREAIILKVQRTFNAPKEVTKCLRNKTIPQFNEPNPDSVAGITDELSALCRERANLKYKEEFRWYMRKKGEFEDNFFKAFALIWEVYCSSELRRAIEELPNFDSGTAKIRDDPLKLLEIIANLISHQLT